MFLVVLLVLFTNVIICKIPTKYICKHYKNNYIYTCNFKLLGFVYLLFGKANRLLTKLILKGGE